MTWDEIQKLEPGTKFVIRFGRFSKPKEDEYIKFRVCPQYPDELLVLKGPREIYICLAHNPWDGEWLTTKYWEILE